MGRIDFSLWRLCSGTAGALTGISMRSSRDQRDRDAEIDGFLQGGSLVAADDRHFAFGQRSRGPCPRGDRHRTGCRRRARPRRRRSTMNGRDGSFSTSNIASPRCQADPAQARGCSPPAAACSVRRSPRCRRQAGPCATLRLPFRSCCWTVRSSRSRPRPRQARPQRHESESDLAGAERLRLRLLAQTAPARATPAE